MDDSAVAERVGREIDRARATARRSTFLHQDGLVLCMTLAALDDVGLLKRSLDAELPLAEMAPEVTESGFAYLRVGLRSIAGAGWIEPSSVGATAEQTVPRWTVLGRAVANYHHHYVVLGRFLGAFTGFDWQAWSEPWDRRTVAEFAGLVDVAGAGWELGADLPPDAAELVRTHLDGAVTVPAMLRLHAAGVVGESELTPTGDDEFDGATASLLELLGWLDARSWRWTATGRVAGASSLHYGLAASYLPLFRRLPRLYRGTETASSSVEGGEGEWHVNRTLNVIAAGAAHRRYFSDANEVIVTLFDREPLAAQPGFVADVGCGDGSWLASIYEVVREQTLRGRKLEQAPLVMVGIDANEAALEQARSVLGAAGVPALLLRGDISDPGTIRRRLADHGLAMEDGLHIRSFLDHDRRYEGDDSGIPTPGRASGAYVGAGGRILTAREVERDLIGHLRRWAPHVRRHGMVVLEAHCVPPGVAARHQGALHSLAFDAYHGYSHQYPVEHAVFVHCCREAGLARVCHQERRYPTTRPFTAVSLNRLLAGEPSGEPFVQSDAGAFTATVPDERRNGWSPPGADLEDGRALHEFLYVQGDLRHPRLWCSAATGWLVARTLEAIEERLALARPGEVIRILDYGTGTGLATIELLKACRERQLESRLEAAGVAFELHLADLPSSWFAQAHELLHRCSWTRFHSLRDPGGRFRNILELSDGRPFDAVVASMVFHLIPARAMVRVAADLANAMTPAGQLLWNSPDLGPPGPYSVLFHDPNRALRQRWLALMDGEAALLGNGAARHDRVVAEAVRRVRSNLGPADRAACARRAERRILQSPNEAAFVNRALGEHLRGTMERCTFEMLDGDFVDALLIPSNGGEYLSEIDSRAERDEVIRRLMLGEILPAFWSGPATTGLGLSVKWTFGAMRSKLQS